MVELNYLDINNYKKKKKNKKKTHTNETHRETEYEYEKKWTLYYGVSSCSDECDCNILTFKSNLTNKHRVDKIRWIFDSKIHHRWIKRRKKNVQRQMQQQPSLFDIIRPIHTHTHTFKLITKTKNYKKNLNNNSNISIYIYTPSCT